MSIPQLSLQDGPVQGIKLELFIFDTFPLAEPGKVALMEVDRAAEFAPVKNAPGGRHKKWCMSLCYISFLPCFRGQHDRTTASPSPPAELSPCPNAQDPQPTPRTLPELRSWPFTALGLRRPVAACRLILKGASRLHPPCPLQGRAWRECARGRRSHPQWIQG